MAQAFVTTYRNHYRWNKQPKRKSKRPVDLLVPHDEDLWIDSSVKKLKEDLNVPYAEALIKQARGRIMFSTYQVSYCRDKVRAKRQTMRQAVSDAAGDTEVNEPKDQSFENELLKYCETLYKEKKTSKLIPPGSSARRVQGYIRPQSLYTPLTNYQSEYGKAGYDILRDPLLYFNTKKKQEENNSFPLCTTSEILSSLKRSEEFQKNRKEREKKERDWKLDKIILNLDRCSNYVKNPDNDACPCNILF